MSDQRVGIWFIGARGGVATTTILGLVALSKGAAGSTGLVSALPRFSHLDLTDWSDWVVGGHEIRGTRLADEAMQLADVSRAIDRDLVRRCVEDLDAIDSRIRPGVLVNVGKTIESLADDRLRTIVETPAAAVARIREDLLAFARDNQLSQVVVMNVASTEPAPDLDRLPGRSRVSDFCQLAVCDCCAGFGLCLCQFHSVARVRHSCDR